MGAAPDSGGNDFMNAYTIEFHVACPVNGVRVKFQGCAGRVGL